MVKGYKKDLELEYQRLHEGDGMFQVEVAGKQVKVAKAKGWKAFLVRGEGLVLTGTTAIELPATSPADATRKARKAGFEVLNVWPG
jgi:hypothetical protein